MNLSHVDKIAKAVLYEGYMLYPYRPSAVKNQRRFNFGVLHPEACARQRGESCALQTECLAQTVENSSLEVRLRFLRLVQRSVGTISEGTSMEGPDFNFQPVARLEVDGRIYQSWQEAAEQEVLVPTVELTACAQAPIVNSFELPSSRSIEAIEDEGGHSVGVVVRDVAALRGSLSISAETLREGVLKLTLRVSNKSDRESPELSSPDDLLADSFLSVHFVLGIENGAFISLLDPPADVELLVPACHNSGLWPILVGEPGVRDTLLCSPIILYDYPQIAAESPGDLFDATEIDEILSLRILTLTDEEKKEMRASDARSQAILERTESLSPEHWSRLHGTLRSLRTAKEKVS